MITAGASTSRDRLGLAAQGPIDHLQIIKGLAQRELQSRFGQNVFGYAWSFVAPLVWIAAAYFAFLTFGRTSPVYTDLVTFIISGLIPYATFRYTVTAVSRASTLVRPLLIFPSLKIEHGAITLAVMEGLNLLLVYLFVAGLNLLIFGNGELDDPSQFFAGLFLAWALGASLGYLFMTLGLINKTFEHIGPIILRPAFFLSGIFFTANELPDYVLEAFGYNPILHVVEIARDGMLFNYRSRVASPSYVVLWIIGLLGVALLVRGFRRRY